jgi:flavin-dependent thymidylate synthase
MKVILSGFNIDVETIKELKAFIQRVAEQLDEPFFNSLDPKNKKYTLQVLQQEAVLLWKRDNLTPETLSAAYARISRNPKPVNELREIARQEVDLARKSNQNIIFGLGHSSVAEHAVFNFDILGVSRYAVETVEHFRLASYTEKSQRYILFEDDFVVPEEIRGTPLEQEYIALIREQNKSYYQLYDLLRPYFLEKFRDLAAEQKNQRMLDGLAKEDARYVISLATQTQLGMTVNARTLENMIIKSLSHSLAEVREYGQRLYNEVREFTPSIIKYTKPTAYLKEKDSDLKSYLSLLSIKSKPERKTKEEVTLIDFPVEADEKILASILFRLGDLGYKKSLAKIRKLDPEQKVQFYKKVFVNINSWDSVLREFEFVQLTFELVISGSAFGQLKRHRMTNIISQEYHPGLGHTIPESIKETGQENILKKIAEKSDFLYQKINKISSPAAVYILTNSHRRRVLFKINLRELYHFTRLREDAHAQWDIRQIASKMAAEVRKKMPLACMLLGGKDLFQEKYQNIFSNQSTKN